VTETLTVVAGAAPTFITAGSATFVSGQLGVAPVAALGYPLPNLTESGKLPKGVSFTNEGSGVGILTGTPATGAAGTYTVTLTATNGFASVVQHFTLTVHQPPAFTSAARATATVGTSSTVTITATGSPLPAIGITGHLPKGMTFKTAGGGHATITGKPTPGTGGSYTLTLTATNGTGVRATQTFVLVVDQAPAFTSPASASFTPKKAGSFTVTTSGYPSGAVTIHSGHLPATLTLTTNHNGTATISGTPTTAAKTTYKIVLQVTNGVGSPVPQTFTLTVT
jgi:Putative Ig domain